MGDAIPLDNSATKEDVPQTNGETAAASEPKIERIRASKIEYKTVNQIWDRKNYGRKLVESLEDGSEEDKYEEYVFVERRDYDESNMHYKTFVDIKSVLLRDILREVLDGVNTVSLRGDKPEIPVKTLFHFLTQLEARRNPAPPESDKESQHLDLLIHYLREHFASTLSTLPPLLEHGEITFELLWALFPPNAIVHTIDSASEQPKCIIFDFGDEVQTLMKEKNYILYGRHLDTDGKVLGEVSTNEVIQEFRGAKAITALEAFPLNHHQEVAEVKSALIERGKRFVALNGVHHCSYHGLAHYKKNREPIKFQVKGRFMVDPLSFKEHNANYEIPPLDNVIGGKSRRRRQRRNPDDVVIDPTTGLLVEGTSVVHAPILDVNTHADEMKEEQFLVCSPTVLGFSLDRRIWAEFAVANIQDIRWATLPFDTLVIPEKKKNMLQALVRNHVAEPDKISFDDFVEGKGQGLIVLLHGPPGVGKTLTAEAISEHRHRPLYRVTAADLGLDSQSLESNLTEILDLTARWKAILLLDEADVFLESRERMHLQHNTLVSVFLRQLEYFQGVMILTTNRVTSFDDAVQSRIHLGIKYEPLSKKAKEEVWRSFLKQADVGAEKEKKATVTAKQLEELSRKDFNGRQIKNTVRMAYSLALAKTTSLSYEDIIDAIEANEDFDDDFRGGHGKSEAMHSYQ